MDQLIDRPWKPGDTIAHPEGGEQEIVIVEICERQATFEARGWRLKALTRGEAIAKIRKWIPKGFEIYDVLNNGIILVHISGGELVAAFSVDSKGPGFQWYDDELWEKIPDVVGRIWMQVEL